MMQGQAKSIVLIKANKLRLVDTAYLADQDNDVLVKTIATTITPGLDRLLLTNKPVSHRVITYPIMLGSEMIGQVLKQDLVSPLSAPGISSTPSKATDGRT